MPQITNIVAVERWSLGRVLMWGTAATLLLIPAVAMQFPDSQFDWVETDFIVMGAMLAMACGACELAARASRNGAYRFAALIAVGTAFLTVWANLAVGMIRSEDHPYNLLFGGVLALALVAAVAARFAAAGMARATLVTALAQAAVGAAGLPLDQRGAIFSTAFALPWLLSAWLFARAARHSA